MPGPALGTPEVVGRCNRGARSEAAADQGQPRLYALEDHLGVPFCAR